ncbi:MAG: ParB N-terminal domain-containing protein [Synergistaceae bacterium]|nr:ParB N-terminal domain-containing protein [Synergistaceae bacterium]
MNDNELFEEQTEQIERMEQITEERNETAEDVTERLDSRNEADREIDIEPELIEVSESEIDQLSSVPQQCIYVSLDHLKPFSGALYDENDNKRIISGNPFFVPDNYLKKRDDKKNDKDAPEIESIRRLHASIEQEGVLTPLLVRHAKRNKATDYEILSGYRRKRVCEELAKTNPEKFQTVPVLVIEPCDDDTANSIITSSNVQRREISLLETIKSCGRMYRALRHRGKKDKGRKGKQDKPSLTADTVAQILGLKPRTVRRYSQLLELPEELLELVASKAKNDNEELRLPIKAGETLTGIGREKLEVINKLLKDDVESSISVSDAKKIKKFCTERSTITEDEIQELLRSNKTSNASEVGKEGAANKTSTKRRFSLDNKRLQPYCGEMTDQEIENLIYQLITEWGEKKA